MKNPIFSFEILISSLFLWTIFSCSPNSNNDDTTTDDEAIVEPIENIFDYDLVLTNQLEIDLFGEENYTRINGEVIIDGTDVLDNRITNLSPLNSINSIGGSLTIKHTDLVNLDGLENVSSPVDVLYIQFNDELTNVNSLGGITEFNSIYIEGNDRLLNLVGLEGAEEINYLTIRSNADLRSLRGLENLSSIDGMLSLRSNNVLSDIQSLSNLEFADRIVLGHTSVNTLSGLSGLLRVRSLEINNNHNLTNLTGLEELTHLERFDIRNNQSMTSLDGFSQSISTLNNLLISNNSHLDNLSGLNNVTEITDTFSLLGNSALNQISLEGLVNCRVVYIENNGLQTLSFPALENCNVLNINDNYNLVEFQNSSLDFIGRIEFEDNEQLNFLSFDNLASIGHMRLWNNDQLLNFNFPQLNSMSGNLQIGYNSLLENLDGLTFLTHLQSANIVINNSLVDFCGLNTLANNMNLNSDNFTCRGNGCNVMPGDLTSSVDCACN
ncbi:hypothetical protein BST97_03680 [Nonlabens spongiae]|uniref:Receptor L-domain domain-containing protein n=1 Tax=Nonlabens spongiae TaxID=331648 RepID=A0A1W6MHV7_9FLAO|nr:hypothetical protein [Nonlabens spongiae]ARN77160.1 hypothetical protein BST97_03680 [Nonlabens spongiae]